MSWHVYLNLSCLFVNSWVFCTLIGAVKEFKEAADSMQKELDSIRRTNAYLSNAPGTDKNKQALAELINEQVAMGNKYL